ncbi:dicarboxylate--CoA ligase PimA [Tsuneonella deserti]|uniref:Dicarboxylate--CoA ligase PimA n=1 Tax=Tsuneonella deserti TaxID=2035528 RepID=A0ABQ1SCE3_9SPHN|nr:dicarboxylate--CoA ligase PimA [Tsuneonella deserti]
MSDPDGHPSPADYRHPCAWDVPLPSLTVPGLLERAAREAPDAPATDFMGRRQTYAQVLDEARAFAFGLRARGIGPGDRVGLFLPNVPIYLSAYYGTMLAGAVAVNFSPLYTVEELEAQVADSGTRLLVTVDVASLLPTALKVLDGSALETLVVGSLSAMLPWPKRVALTMFGRKSLGEVPDRRDVVRWDDALDRQIRPLPPVSPTDLALLQYTGGTTGRPKGAMLSHANLAANALQVDAIDPFEGRDMILGVLPFFHVFANTCVLNRTVAKRGCIAMLPRFEAGQALKLQNRVKATALPGVPTMFQALLDHPRLPKTDLSSLNVCISGGAPLPAPVRDKWEAATGSRLVEGYGLTESSGVVSTNPYLGERRAGTIGQVLPHTRVRLLDKEDPSRAAPAGEPGELAVAGPQVMQGYWNLPEAAAEAFVEASGIRWLRTGDVAVIDAQGFITIVDRIKDMIAVGGFKVFPSQVEAVLLENPAIKEALVLGLPDPYLGETPAAFVTLNEGDSVTGESLAEWLNARVGKHERVSAVTVRETLPKTMIGKLDRKALRAEVAAAI